jgi:hypothetical protein
MLNVSEATAAVVVESSPLWVVADMLNAGRFEVVLVLKEDQQVMGLVRPDAVLRLAPRLPEAPVRMLPLQRVVEVPRDATLEHARDVLTDASVDALLIEKSVLEGWRVVLRDVVLTAAA